MHSSKGFLLRISGEVQGVGFRPCVWRVACALKLNGWVFNTGAGVEVAIQGDAGQLTRFIERLQQSLPALASIDNLYTEPADVVAHDFTIRPSQSNGVIIGCAVDTATCAQCLDELFDPQNRRYRYPFINCTQCGPRLSIIQNIPYDRANTTMSAFTQCPVCADEYHDPANRRFHAQPNACPVCGPEVWLEDAEGCRIPADDPFIRLAEAVRAGQIVAIKGIGGFHLACDATSETAVEKLRQRKQRPAKPLALMANSIDQIRRYAQLDAASEMMLRSPAAPIVLLSPHNGARELAPSVAPGQYQQGFMLPSTPMHWLLLTQLDRPLVMTSGNQTGTPPAISNTDAREQLASIADLLLLHNRPIHNRVDDSLVRQLDGQQHILRRARGFAPRRIELPPGFEQAPDLLALGADLKNTLCLLQSGQAIMSQHLGDLANVQTFAQFQHTQRLYQRLYQHNPRYLACDLHPGYFASDYARTLADQLAVEVLPVQHHHAHLAACLGENRVPLDSDPVLGICLDGTGYGSDGTLWGGEFLLGDYYRAERLASLKPFPLIGATQAIKAPWRCLFAQLRQALPAMPYNELIKRFPALANKPLATLEQMAATGFNCPMTSSVGRLFDAVAAALGCQPDAISYEGQAAIELETLAWQGKSDIEPYPFTIDRDALQLDPSPFWQALLQDLAQGQKTRADMARAFHLGLAQAITAMAQLLQRLHRFNTIALSGGVMQNQLLFQTLKQRLTAAGFNLLWHQQLPTHDGSIALGQALIAAAIGGCSAADYPGFQSADAKLKSAEGVP